MSLHWVRFVYGRMLVTYHKLILVQTSAKVHSILRCIKCSFTSTTNLQKANRNTLCLVGCKLQRVANNSPLVHLEWQHT